MDLEFFHILKSYVLDYYGLECDQELKYWNVMH